MYSYPANVSLSFFHRHGNTQEMSANGLFYHDKHKPNRARPCTSTTSLPWQQHWKTIIKGTFKNTRETTYCTYNTSFDTTKRKEVANMFGNQTQNYPHITVLDLQYIHKVSLVVVQAHFTRLTILWLSHKSEQLVGLVDKIDHGWVLIIQQQEQKQENR